MIPLAPTTCVHDAPPTDSSEVAVRRRRSPFDQPPSIPTDRSIGSPSARLSVHCISRSSASASERPFSVGRVAEIGDCGGTLNAYSRPRGRCTRTSPSATAFTHKSDQSSDPVARTGSHFIVLPFNEHFTGGSPAIILDSCTTLPRISLRNFSH